MTLCEAVLSSKPGGCPAEGMVAWQVRDPGPRAHQEAPCGLQEAEGELGSAWAVREGFLEEGTSELNTCTTDRSLRGCPLFSVDCLKLLTAANDDPTCVHVSSPALSPYDWTRPTQPGAFLEASISRGEVFFHFGHLIKPMDPLLE